MSAPEPPDRVERRSPLAMVVLSLLEEAPMHPYRMQRLIQAREKDQVVNVAQRNSIYQAIERLLRAGLVQGSGTTREGGRPERTVYAITDAGRATLRTWLRAMLSERAREFPDFPAALAFLPVLAPEDAHLQLTTRLTALDAHLRQVEAGLAHAHQMGVPRLFLVESEYTLVTTRAERDFVHGLIDDLAAGRLTWSLEWIRAIAARFEPAGQEG
jgi:DNA-binding PadR family transcriptional regulator